MESPTISLSRTASSTFAPGSHRRSHPNLQHLSLAPLTPKYPIDPADYDAYFDPSTSELHTSTSISHISGLPSPGGILTNSPARSRASSRTRLKKKNKSSVSIRAPNDLPLPLRTSTPSGALSSEGFGHRKSALRLHHHHHPDSSWLVQTGLALTEGSRETKGQSWIGKRDSSTSLHALGSSEDQQHRIHRSDRTTPNRSRPTSRRHSRRQLAMTPAAGTTPGLETAAPDWADQETQAEIAAQVESEIYDELDFDENEDDPYGMLNFEEQFDSEDEEAVRREISGYKLGKWMDGIVDVFLRLDEEFPDSEFAGSGGGLRRDLEAGEQAESPEAKETVAVKRSVHSDGEAIDATVEPPPERPKGLWDDVAWFGRMVARTVRS